MADIKIPKGIYCYDNNGRCGHFEWRSGKAFCTFLQKSEEDDDYFLLWDQVKECGENTDFDEEKPR
jgi:hypothetical protein